MGSLLNNVGIIPDNSDSQANGVKIFIWHGLLTALNYFFVKGA